MERYQEALHVDRTDPGERDSSERWAHIEAHLPKSGLIVDIGSNLGFFGLRAVYANADVAVVSIESSHRIAESQRRLLAEHGIDRICLLQGVMDARAAAAWAQTCDFVQLTLALSILHWMDDPAEVLRQLSSMSASVIAEVPDGNDIGACGGPSRGLWGDDPVSWFAEQTGRSSTLLARIGRHTSDVPSHLILVEGPVSRRPSLPYWGYDFSRSEPRDYRVAYDGSEVELEIRGRKVDYRPGLNLLSLMRLGTLLYPEGRWWRNDAERALTASPGHSDPYPHNMLWTPSGLVLIDEDDLIVEQSSALVMASFEKNLSAWEHGRTRRYVREVLGPRRLARRVMGRVARRLFGDRFVERFKLILEGPRRGT